MARYGYKYILYQYDKAKFPFPYVPRSHAYAHDYREAFIKLITLLDIRIGTLQSYFIGHYKSSHPKSAANMYVSDVNGIKRQMEMYQAAPSRTLANKAAKLHRKYYVVGRRNGESAEEVRRKHNDYQREYMRIKRAYDKWRDIMTEILGFESDIPLWRDRITDEPWEDDPAPTVKQQMGRKVELTPVKKSNLPKLPKWKSQDYINKAIPRPHGGRTSFLDDEDDEEF